MTSEYFECRGVTPDLYENFRLPEYMKKTIPSDKNITILDVGCGFGQMIQSLQKMGYENLTGIDIDATAVSHCLSKGLVVNKIDTLKEYCLNYSGNKFDLIIASHVLEHIEKSEIVETVKLIRETLLSPHGRFLTMVPNAQSNTGCYWAYEDFTHSTLFTAGSIYFVLKGAGFEKIEFLDPDGLDNSSSFTKPVRKLLLFYYRMNKKFWNLVTGSSFHDPSPQIFTYELKVMAS